MEHAPTLSKSEDGQIEEPYSISAGLDYPGIGPMHANLAAQKRAIVLSVNDDEAIRAAYELTKLEGIIPRIGKRPRPRCIEEAELQNR